MRVLGLTGSIGMGKSTTAKLFAEAGVPVYDADATVHMVYEGEAAPAIEAAFPGTTVDGKVDRNRLSAQLVQDPVAIRRLEQIVEIVGGGKTTGWDVALELWGPRDNLYEKRLALQEALAHLQALAVDDRVRKSVTPESVRWTPA